MKAEITSESAAQAKYEGAQLIPGPFLNEALGAHSQTEWGCSRQRAQATAGAGRRGHIGGIIKPEENGGQNLHIAHITPGQRTMSYSARQVMGIKPSFSESHRPGCMMVSLPLR